MKEIVAATNNPDKLREIREILGTKFSILSLKDEGVSVEIVENGLSFYDNALIKAKTVTELTGKPSLADDSGLIVPALGGAPGIYSARYGGEDCDSLLNRAKLLKEMKDIENRDASFYSSIVLFFPDSTVVSAEGEAKGMILKEEQGTKGFGYDSLFFSFALKKSFAEATPEEKNSVSHRGVALKNLLKKLSE
ncbi:MAG: RdgB/HAM1 family non-canonical purine NTP pyrophosphatase [Clostridia bacterium]|jgi:XTP/dITP diphosphohydrolase|nr:MAG: dITP/XTP pyrophosphatase [Firmicutes bacterium ADurb.Bin080]